jgi:hypothetical protein
MTGPRADRPPAVPATRRAGVGLLVLAGHALLVAGLVIALRPGPVPRLVDARPPLLWLRLPLLHEQAAPAARTDRTNLVGRRREPDRARLPTAPPAAQPRAITPSAADAAALAGVGSTADAAVVSEVPASHPAPLDLSLPRARQAPPGGLRDHARLPPPATRDARLAWALGTDTTLREEARGEQRRFRRGSACVDTRPARIGQLDPFNQSAHPLPRLAEPC